MDYDLIVIGAGGGAKIATPAAKLGKKVAIIEKEDPGGTCLNRGCIPSKMLIHPANVLVQARDAKKFGITFSKEKKTFAGLVKRVTKTVKADSASIPQFWEKVKGLDYYHEEAKFIDNNTVHVGAKKITGEQIIIATGSRPLIPDIPGLKGTPYMTSREALRNRRLPKRLIVLGAGYIACELGHVYGTYGSQTHFLARSVLLSREDVDTSHEFTKIFSQHHKVSLHTKILRVKYSFGKFTVFYEQEGKKKKTKGDALLVAIGVVPNTEGLGLEKTDVQITQKGYISVNKYLQTKAKNIYAIGDVVGNYLFRHSVNFEGEYLFNQLFGGTKRATIKYPPMPHVVFSHPEIAVVGKTEQQLTEEGTEFVIGMNKYENSAMGMARLPDHGFVKLLFDKKTKKLLGAHIVGDEAATMIHQAIYAMTYDATLDDLLNMIYVHPALPEIFRNACRKAKEKF